MSSDSPAFQFYPKDYLADENQKLMSNQERGCYTTLMCHSWLEGSIPADVGKIARLCNEPPEIMAQLWLAISPCFVELERKPGRLVNPRLEEERKKQEKHRLERSESGAKGAKSRWDRRCSNSKVDSSANGSVNGLASGSATQEPKANDGSSSSSSSSLDKTNEEEEEKKPTSPETLTPKQIISNYVAPRTKALQIGSMDDKEIDDWLTDAGGDTAVILEGIDAGLKVFQAGKPGRYPNSARFYRAYVTKAIERAGRDGHGRTGGGPATATGEAAATRLDGDGRKATGTPAPDTGGNTQSGAGKPGTPQTGRRRTSFNHLSQ